MTERQSLSLARYIRNCADRLGLRDWKIGLDDAPCDDHADASVYVIREIHTAHVQVSSEFLTLTPERQRQVIAHEMAHVHMGADIDYLKVVLPALVGQVAWAPIEAALTTMHEQGIDGVSIGMAFALPLWECPK